MALDKVSVIIPSYNQRIYVVEAIESVLCQSHPQIEIIVVDDGSTDGTRDALEEYRGKIQIIHQANAGISAARNTGIKQATGQYICLLDQDDLFLPDKIARQLAVFHERTDVGLVHTGAAVIRKGHEGWEFWYGHIPPEYLSREQYIDALLQSNFIVCSTVMAKRDLFLTAGLFNEGYSFGEDYDMWLRMLGYCNFAAIPEVLLDYRWHGQNATLFADPSVIPAIQKKAAKRFGKA